MLKHQKTLLILDVDETLILSRGRQIEGRSPDFCFGPYFVYQRPHLKNFITNCSAFYELAIWSSAGSDYINAVIANIMPPKVVPVFIWCRDRCTSRTDHETGDIYFAKDLKKVKRKGYDLNRVLIVEDLPQNVRKHYGNAIYVSSYKGQPDDEELLLLEQFLISIHTATNVREIEKRGWRG